MLYDIEKNKKRESFNEGFWDDFTNRDVFDDFPYARRKRRMPPVNVMENDKEFIVELMSPGMCKDNYLLEVENDVLTISGKIEEEDPYENRDYSRQEFCPASFERAFLLPEYVNADEISASCSDGILTIHIPKQTEARVGRKRSIDIE